MEMHVPALAPHYAQHAELKELRAEAERLLARHGFDAGHDMAHADRVAQWTLRLLDESPAEDRAEPREVVAAALLHDVVNLPKDHPERRSASRMSADVARELLPRFGFSAPSVSRIAEAIEDHSYSRGAIPRSALGRALQDADRLETLGAIGLMRVFSTGARLGARYFDPADPWSKEREPDDLRYSIDHFRTKLLRLPKSMCTDAGRQEGTRRAERMVRFLDELADEIGVPRAPWARVGAD